MKRRTKMIIIRRIAREFNGATGRKSDDILEESSSISYHAGDVKSQSQTQP
jgi:hypothetical protein